jgi:hypothetical protein
MKIGGEKVSNLQSGAHTPGARPIVLRPMLMPVATGWAFADKC